MLLQHIFPLSKRISYYIELSKYTFYFKQIRSREQIIFIQLEHLKETTSFWYNRYLNTFFFACIFHQKTSGRVIGLQPLYWCHRLLFCIFLGISIFITQHNPKAYPSVILCTRYNRVLLLHIYRFSKRNVLVFSPSFHFRYWHDYILVTSSNLFVRVCTTTTRRFFLAIITIVYFWAFIVCITQLASLLIHFPFW